MLKKIIIAAGTLLAAALIAAPPASAHRAYRAHRGIAAHGIRVARPHIAARAGHAGVRHRAVLAQRGHGRHHIRFADGRDRSIRRHVGPAYQQIGTPVSGAQVGGASYYGGRHRTASGGVVGAATCAHRTLPFGTHVLVTNLANARQAMLIVNDRGPFVRGRIVDVSVGAASLLGMLHSGTARVSVQVVGGPG